MRKLLIKLLLCILALTTVIGLGACSGNGDWKGTSMKNWGADVTSGGFIAETANYLYYVNGYASYSEDNTFGTPVKGSLMAVEKSSIKSGNLKTEIVVPKLFVSTDYSAGVYVYDGYVYYGTPSTDKTNAGEIAKSEMTFTKTKLDGTGTQTFFTVSSHATEYRFIKSGSKVFLVYYDIDDSALYAYDTTTKEKTTIAKKDSETKGKFESLASYKFMAGEGVDGVVVVYSATVYSEDYFEAAASKDNYARAEAAYNKVYAYKVGDGVSNGNEFRGACILNGQDSNEFNHCKYTLNTVKAGEQATYLFYTETDVLGNATDYAVEVGNFDQAHTTEIVNPDLVFEDMLFVSLDEVYLVVEEGEISEGNEEDEIIKIFLVRTTLTQDDTVLRVKVAEMNPSCEPFAKKVEGGKTYIYYFNSTNQIARVEIVQTNDKDTEYNDEERISEDSVASAWYTPEFITIDGEEYLFYCDNSAKGASYVKYVKLTGATVTAEDSDDDGEDDLFYIEGHKFLGKITDYDSVQIAKVDLNALKVISWNVEDGFVGEEEVVKARASYNALSKEAKDLYGEESLAKIQNVEKALSAAKLLYKLDGIINYEVCDADTKLAYKNAYESAKATMAELKDNTDVLSYIDNNMKYNFYEKATDLFAK